MTWLLGAGISTVFSTALLTLPALLAVRRLLARRVAAPFARDQVERQLVLIAAIFGSLGALAIADGCALALYAPDSSASGTILAALIAPVPLAAVPWAAGEMLSGSSLRPFQSFAAAAAVSSAISWVCYGVLWTGQPRQPLTPSIACVQLAVLFLSAHLAARSYLAVRGKAVHALPPAALALERL